MKKLAKFLFIFNALIVSLGAHAANPGEGRWVAEEVFRSANTGAMTGLVHMNSAYTVREGELQVNVGFTSESIGGVSYTQAPLTITYGLSDNKEVGLVARYISSSSGVAGLGGAEIKLKWRFRRQTEYLPATAILIGLMAPTGPAALNEVSSFGLRVHGLASSEANVTDTFYIGMYLDVGVVLLDPGTGTADNYLDISAGLLFPISDDNRLQAMLEYNSVSRRAVAYLGSSNYTSFAPALRYATKSFKTTLGAELRSNGATKITATLGFEF